MKLDEVVERLLIGGKDSPTVGRDEHGPFVKYDKIVIYLTPLPDHEPVEFFMGDTRICSLTAGKLTREDQLILIGLEGKIRITIT